MAHVRESLPSWLERLPDWDPIVVCCDDPIATEYASGELYLAQRGIVVSISQGQYFNKLEAIRLGVDIAACGFDPRGQTIGAETVERYRETRSIPPDSMVAQLDADTVANHRTAALMASVGRSEAGICGFGIRDDLGFLVVALPVLVRALELMPVGWFEGYGPEDCAIRVACWTLLRKPFRRLQARWARIQHSDAERVRYHSRSMLEAVRTNKRMMGELMARLIAPEDLAICKSDCLGWPKHPKEFRHAS